MSSDMHRNYSPEREAEWLAELQLRLDGARVPGHELLEGALTLACLGYVALSQQYAARAWTRLRAPGRRAQAGALLLSGSHQGRA